jgi:hypothetical protein
VESSSDLTLGSGALAMNWSWVHGTWMRQRLIIVLYRYLGEWGHFGEFE